MGQINEHSDSDSDSILVYLDPSGGMYTTPSNKSFGISKISLLILYHPTNSLSVVISVINVSSILFLFRIRRFYYPEHGSLLAP